MTNENFHGTWPAAWKLQLLFWWAAHCGLDIQPAPSDRLKYKLAGVARDGIGDVI